jgi:putative phosphoribosyl transferase
MIRLPFVDRFEAGRLLGEALAKRKLLENSIVLGLARGGVAVAYAASAVLGAPLDVVVVRKLGIQCLGVSPREVDAVEKLETEELERRQKLYRQEHPAPDLFGWTVILVDDGLATGSTMHAALDYAYSFHPKAVIVATPVASVEACEKMKRLADECICLATPDPFLSVGSWYVNFDQLKDYEVTRLLEMRRRQTGPLLRVIKPAPQLQSKA